MASLTRSTALSSTSRYGAAAAFSTILVDYHREGRFLHDGIFNDNKMPLQYYMGKDDMPSVVADAQNKFDVAKLAYEHQGNERYQLLDSITDAYGLDASAFRDTQTGQIIIGICGIETKHADGKTDIAQDVYAAFKSTSGAVSQSTPALIDFTRRVQEEHGAIGAITGHSVGGYLGMQLKVIGEKQGFIDPNTTLHTYDMAGMTRALANNLNEQYGVTENDINKSLHSDRVTSVINDRNSFNTLGAQPGRIITATAPTESAYLEHSVTHLLPKRHTLPRFDESFAAGQWHEGDNYGHARGPEYLTAVAVSNTAGAVTPYAYAGNLWPVLRHAQGSAGHAMVGDITMLLHATDGRIIDGDRGIDEHGLPIMTAYSQLNMLYNEVRVERYSQLETEQPLLSHEARLGLADAYARNPNQLAERAQKKIEATEVNLEDPQAVIQAVFNSIDRGALRLGGAIVSKSEVADLPMTLADVEAKQAREALQELSGYRHDYLEAGNALNERAMRAALSAVANVDFGKANADMAGTEKLLTEARAASGRQI